MSSHPELLACQVNYAARVNEITPHLHPGDYRLILYCPILSYISHFFNVVYFDPQDLVQVKYEMLRRVRVDGLSVKQASSDFGFSRPSFYQAQSAFEHDSLDANLRADFPTSAL